MRILSDISAKAGLNAAEEVTIDSLQLDNTLSSVVVYDSATKELKIRNASTLVGSGSTSAQNIGTGVGVFESNLLGVLRFKSISNGSGISVSGTATNVVVTNTGVLSVNGKTGVATLNTDEIPEASNLYFTNARARQAISGSGVISFNQSTGVISASQASVDTNGFLSFSDWQSFNSRVPSTRTVNTNKSITGGGSLNSDLTISLVNDVTSPAPNFYYGTDGSGVKGWYVLPSVAAGTVTSVNGQTGTVVLTTTNIAEGTNLYFTNARSRSALSGGTGINYDQSTGLITNTAPDQTVVLTQGPNVTITGTYPSFTISAANNFPSSLSLSAGVLTLGRTGLSSLTASVSTTDVTEGTNLYFTEARSRQAISQGAGITYNSSTGVITNSDPDQVVTIIQGAGILVSGSYPNFTIASSITQYTDALARAALSSGAGISYNQSTGVITNSAPDQVVVLNQGANITITGTYPNFTISASSGVSTVGAEVGQILTFDGSVAVWMDPPDPPEQVIEINQGLGISVTGSSPTFTVGIDVAGASAGQVYTYDGTGPAWMDPPDPPEQIFFLSGTMYN